MAADLLVRPDDPSSVHRPSLCYVTASYLGDIERFALLRLSLNLFSPGIPHLAYIETEDCAAFVRRFGSESGLSIIPTAELLSAALERERRLRRVWYGRLIERLGWRMGWNSRLAPGWKVQQVTKLEALSRLPFDAAVFLDSDIVLCAARTADDYRQGPLLRLLETTGETYEDAAFEVGRQLILGRSILDRVEIFNYIHYPPRFLRRTGIRLKGHLQERWTHWYKPILEQAFPSEYNLLGFVARKMESYDGYLRDPADPVRWVYAVKRLSELDLHLALCRQEGGRRGFLLIQSNLGMSATDYGPRVRTLLECLAA